MPVSGPQEALSDEMSKDKELPVTSYPCKRNVPHTQKHGTHFEKHDYRMMKKAKYKSVHDFDPSR